MDKGVLPRHVAIIMDGNGRWARQRGKERVFGHHEGAESVRACSELAVETGIEYLSFFAFSEENWNRPEAEVSELMRLMAVSILNEKPTFRKNNIRFVVIGNRSRLPEDLNRDIDEAMEEAVSSGTIPENYSVSFKYDLPSFFNDFDFINASKFAQYAGINESKMRQYKSGVAYPGERTAEKILGAIHRIGAELSSVSL